MVSAWNSAGGDGDGGSSSGETGGAGFPAVTAPPADPPLTEPAGAAAEAAAGELAGEPAGAPEDLITEISVSVRKLADSSQRYHTRAEQRESVIDYLRAELEQLRQGERRGLLRPVLAEMCRLRDDLLKQAATLPADFDAAKTADLLRSYAESIELTLESNGVVTYAPEAGDPFNPRMHRRVSGEPTADPTLAGHVAALNRDGYLDIEANSPIAPAEVTVYAVTQGEQGQ
ncbi:MAG: nucleotide exchange factor GrpE [Streptosporangiaceae bacterium]